MGVLATIVFNQQVNMVYQNSVRVQQVSIYNQIVQVLIDEIKVDFEGINVNNAKVVAQLPKYVQQHEVENSHFTCLINKSVKK